MTFKKNKKQFKSSEAFFFHKTEISLKIIYMKLKFYVIFGAEKYKNLLAV